MNGRLRPTATLQCNCPSPSLAVMQVSAYVSTVFVPLLGLGTAVPAPRRACCWAAVRYTHSIASNLTQALANKVRERARCVQIFGRLAPRDAARCTVVCTLWKRFAGSSQLWQCICNANHVDLPPTVQSPPCPPPAGKGTESLILGSMCALA